MPSTGAIVPAKAAGGGGGVKAALDSFVSLLRSEFRNEAKYEANKVRVSEVLVRRDCCCCSAGRAACGN